MQDVTPAVRDQIVVHSAQRAAVLGKSVEWTRGYVAAALELIPIATALANRSRSQGRAEVAEVASALLADSAAAALVAAIAAPRTKTIVRDERGAIVAVTEETG